MNKLIEFLSLSDINLRYVVLGSVILAASSAIVGCFTFLKKKSLVGDAVAHSVLPGVCLAFLLAGNKNPVALIIGAFITGWLSLVSIDFIVARTKLKEDTAIGLVLSVFFGIGILLLTSIQHSGNASQSGLEGFLFGKAAAMVGSDVIIFSVVGLVLVLTVLLFFKELTLIAFDENFARALGFPVRKLELLLTTLTVLAVVIGIQAVGVVLMAAMLITPAAAARFWTDKLKVMVVLATVLGVISGLSGAFISYLEEDMPTGPWIVLVISIIAIFSFLAAPRKGILARMLRQRNTARKFADENILKLFYHLGESGKDFFAPRDVSQLTQKRNFRSGHLEAGLRRLRSQGYLKKEGSLWTFTQEGYERGRRITKLHRLWEVYLTEHMHVPSDYVHNDADTMEHIITPELEKKLEKKLKYPRTDPHSSEIPYQ